MFSREGATVVSSTYTRVGGLYDTGFRHDPERPLGTVVAGGCKTALVLGADTITQPDGGIMRRVQVDQQADGTYAHGSWCYDAGDIGLDTGIDPHCRLDGGQVLHTKALWDRATADGWTGTPGLPA